MAGHTGPSVRGCPPSTENSKKTTVLEKLPKVPVIAICMGQADRKLKPSGWGAFKHNPAAPHHCEGGSIAYVKA